MIYKVTFVQYHVYEVDADDENDAFHEAYDEFQSDMRCSIADTSYDCVEIDCEEEVED